MQPYSFLSALPAVLALAGFVCYQMLAANRSGDEITRRIVDKLRREAPTETPDQRLNAKQVEHLLSTQQRLREVAGTQDYLLLQQALKQQFYISLAVYLATIGFVAWSVYLFVHQSTVKKDLSVDQIVLSDREPEAEGLLVDLDPLTVSWEAQGEPEDVKVFLENVDTHARTDAKVASSSELKLSFERQDYSALRARREKGANNRLRAVVQAQKSSFRSDPGDVQVGMVMLTLADSTGIDVAAMIDNSRIVNYSFDGKVVIPSKNGGGNPISIGPDIPYDFRKRKVQQANNYDWDEVKAVYLGPDDGHLVRYEYLIDNALKRR